MISLAFAAIFLVVTHFGVASTPLRGALVGRIGEGAYLGAYSLVSLVAFAWLGWAWYHAPVVWLYPPWPWLRWVPAIAVPVALWAIVASVTTPSPTVVSSEGLLDRPDVVTGVLRVTRHPMLWGTVLWAAAHVVANPDLADWIGFSALGVLGLLGPFLIDARRARTHPEGWARFAAVTSNVPFVAIATGRQRVPTETRFWAQGLVGLAVAWGIGWLHPWVLGVVAFPW